MSPSASDLMIPLTPSRWLYAPRSHWVFPWLWAPSHLLKPVRLSLFGSCCLAMVLSVQQAYLFQIPTWACYCEQLITSQWVGAWHLGVRSVDSGRADRCLSGRWRTDKFG